MTTQKQKSTTSLLARALTSTIVLVAVSITLLTALLLTIQLGALQQQLELRARVLGEFVATQSQFAMLVGDREDLERIARNGLAGEDVLFVILAGCRGQGTIQAVRPTFDRRRLPVTHCGEAGWARSNDKSFLDMTRPVETPGKSGLIEWENRSADPSPLGMVRIGFSTKKQQELLRRTVAYGVAGAAGSLLGF